MENLIKQNIDDIVVFEGMTSISSLVHSLELSSNYRSIIKILFDKNEICLADDEVGKQVELEDLFKDNGDK